MIRIAAVEKDAAAVEQVRAELTRTGYEVAPGNGLTEAGGRADVLVVILSPASANDLRMETALFTALDRSQHIVALAAQPTETPRWIDHLTVVDLRNDPQLRATRELLDAALAGDGNAPMRVRTPATQRSNQRIGLITGAIALIMFGVGLYAVGVLGIQAPQGEFDTVETEIVETRDILVRPELDNYAQFLPDRTQAALGAVDYAPTLRLVPTAYRPLMAQTATAYAQGTPLPPRVTPFGQ